MFDYYDADREDLAASETLSKVKTVGDILGKDDEPFSPIDPSTVFKLKDGGAATVAREFGDRSVTGHRSRCEHVTGGPDLPDERRSRRDPVRR